jgi:hypothetical protein
MVAWFSTALAGLAGLKIYALLKRARVTGWRTILFQALIAKAARNITKGVHSKSRMVGLDSALEITNAFGAYNERARTRACYGLRHVAVSNTCR